jgi:hypothetical protein
MMKKRVLILEVAIRDDANEQAVVDSVLSRFDGDSTVTVVEENGPPVVLGERTKALAFADQVEQQLMEVANGQRKVGKLEVQPIGRLIEFIRNGKTYDVTLTAR